MPQKFEYLGPTESHEGQIAHDEQATSEQQVETWIALSKTVGIFLVTIVVVVAAVWIYQNRDSLKWDPAAALVGKPGDWPAVQGFKPVTHKELQEIQRQIDENQRRMQESIRGIRPNGGGAGEK